MPRERIRRAAKKSNINYSETIIRTAIRDVQTTPKSTRSKTKKEAAAASKSLKFKVTDNIEHEGVQDEQKSTRKKAVTSATTKTKNKKKNLPTNGHFDETDSLTESDEAPIKTKKAKQSPVPGLDAKKSIRKKVASSSAAAKRKLKEIEHESVDNSESSPEQQSPKTQSAKRKKNSDDLAEPVALSPVKKVTKKATKKPVEKKTNKTTIPKPGKVQKNTENMVEEISVSTKKTISPKVDTRLVPIPEAIETNDQIIETPSEEPSLTNDCDEKKIISIEHVDSEEGLINEDIVPIEAPLPRLHLMPENEQKPQFIHPGNDVKKLVVPTLSPIPKSPAEHADESVIFVENTLEIINVSDVSDKYNFSMLKTDDSTDDEDDARSTFKRPDPPEWCLKENRIERIINQSQIPHSIIDTFFSAPKNVDLRDIFPGLNPEHMKRRQSSACWTTPPRFSIMPKY